MADKVVVILQQSLKPIKLIKWKVNEGNSVSIGCVVLLYEVNEDDNHVACKLKSTQAGTVRKLLAQEGDVVKPGQHLLELQACIHPTVMRDMCAECGADLRKDDVITTASVPMVHSVPELKVSLEQAQKIGKADSDRLLKDRKLVLLVDLDQTLIHTTNDNIPANIKDVYHFQLYGAHSPWYHTRLRPGTHQFLLNMSPYFELHICTFGARNYAHMIAMFLDQDGKLFSQRILSRDECFNPTSKTANLKALFPCGDNMVCIIDDREDVWSHASNLIHVKPYHFFQHTGDINAPPGLDKHESDEKEGVDLTKTKVKDEKKKKVNGSLPENNLKEIIEEEVTEVIDFNNEAITKSKINNEKNEVPDEKITQSANGVSENETETVNNGKKEEKPEEEKLNNGQENEKDEEVELCPKNKKDDDIQGSQVDSKITDSDVKSKKNNGEHRDNLKEEEINTEEKKVTDNKEANVVSDNKEDKVVSENKVDKVVSENKEDNIVSENKEDKIVSENKEDKIVSEKEEDKVVSENKQDNVVSENKEDTVVPENKENKVVSENKEDKDVSENKEDKVVTDNKEDKNNDENHKSDDKPDQVKTYTNKDKDAESKDDELIEIDDPDDYLLYLEDILKTIHKVFYEKYDQLEAGNVPDLKKVIPEVRKNVLKDTKLVFSGLVPTHIKLEQSKAYQVAKSLGATVTQDLEEDTTHMVAVRPGTAKVNAGRRKKTLKIVTPDWLWSCAERWSKVEERLYPLSNKGSKNRHPPPHCSSPEHANSEEIQNPTSRKRTPSGRFMDTINPLMSFSSADIAEMDQEVEDIFNESESDGESSSKKQPVENPQLLLKEQLKIAKDSDEESSSSEESLTGEHPHGWRPTKSGQKRSRDDQEQDEQDESTADEFPSTKFRRGEELSSDLDIGQESNSEGSVDAPDEIDDGDWNMMGAALEREFLANN